MPGRVERWRGGLGAACLFAGSFACRCLSSQTMLRFPLPLIKPDMRLSRIRLSNKDSRFRPRNAMRPLAELHQVILLVQALVEVA